MSNVTVSCIQISMNLGEALSHHPSQRPSHDHESLAISDNVYRGLLPPPTNLGTSTADKKHRHTLPPTPETPILPHLNPPKSQILQHLQVPHWRKTSYPSRTLASIPSWGVVGPLDPYAPRPPTHHRPRYYCRLESAGDVRRRSYAIDRARREGGEARFERKPGGRVRCGETGTAQDALIILR